MSNTEGDKAISLTAVCVMHITVNEILYAYYSTDLHTTVNELKMTYRSED